MSEFLTRKDPIRRRLAEFAVVPAEEYYYELAYCLLTPQSSAVRAAQAVDALKGADLFHTGIDPAPILRRGSSYIRFHNTKARHLIEAREKFSTILGMLRNGGTVSDKRKWLIDNVKGLGLKEASHFLRNIGHRDLAILDRHILRNLVRYGVIREVPKSLTQKEYLSIERKFRQFSESIRIPLDELDLLFWSSETGEILK